MRYHHYPVSSRAVMHGWPINRIAHDWHWVDSHIIGGTCIRPFGQQQLEHVLVTSFCGQVQWSSPILQRASRWHINEGAMLAPHPHAQRKCDSVLIIVS